MPKRDLPHLFITGRVKQSAFTSIEGGGGEFRLPPRNRKAHGNYLKRQLATLEKDQEAKGFPTDLGMVLEVESNPDYPLKIDSLERRNSGIELLNVRYVRAPAPGNPKARKMLASILIPHGKLQVFMKIVEDYLTKVTEKHLPMNKPLVESIAEIRLGTLSSLWTDRETLPALDALSWWEVWLRAGDSEEERKQILGEFKEECGNAKLVYSESVIHFPERTVILLKARGREIANSLSLLNLMAELRRPKDTASFYTELPRKDQEDWVEDARKLIKVPPKGSPAVCLLDTGLNREHLLIQAVADPKDLHSYRPEWLVTDDTGHGTEMCGLAIYGDLVEILGSKSEIPLTHVIESVKLLPPQGQNPPQLYGEITKACVARAEVQAPKRRRVICSTVTTNGHDRGQPTSWSAAIDQICSGVGEADLVKRLVVGAAGNTATDQRHRYPDSNLTESVQDPGQSWNAVTVGACTEKTTLDPEMIDDWTPLAPAGDLSPCSTTSLIWQSGWPLKPDIVMEGGNLARSNNNKTDLSDPDALRLLTTFWKPHERLLTVTDGTSAATALAARLAAMIWAEYPTLWPETVRALMVHSAEWTDLMTRGLDPWLDKGLARETLRRVGFGIPDATRALKSAKSSLTLIAQETIQPFQRKDGQIKTKDMHLHELPWPTAVLKGLGAVDVTMKVTLSYFIEPNPGVAGQAMRSQTKYRYPSCGLRFQVPRAVETREGFEQRINRIAREQAADYVGPASDSHEWLLGSDLRHAGSIHSDTWRGSAADLANKGYIGIYPVNGWWRRRPHLDRVEATQRYSLVVTIESPAENIDIYTPVENLIKIKI